MSQKSPIFIIDGSSFLYRAYYAMRPLQTSQGIAVQAVYGFCRMVRKIIKDFKVEHIVIVWDSKGKNFRHEIFPEYKATRQQAPIDLFEQKELILKFIHDIKMCQFAQVGIEADDLIYALAKKFHEQNCDVVIVSGDKDLAQIVNHTVKMFDPFKDKMMGQEELQALYGFPLSKLPFYFSLLGDASDNIPGVKGIGKKGATDLVLQFDSLDDLYANINKVDKRRTKELLLDQKDNAYLSLKLFTLQDHVTPIEIADTQFNESDWLLTLPLLKELEFKSLVAEIEKKSSITATSSPEQLALFEESHTHLHEKYTFMLINNEPDLLKLVEAIKQEKLFAVDTETTGLDPMADPCIGISIALHHGTAYYIPFGHTTDGMQLSHDQVRIHLAPIFADASIQKILHHAKFDQVVLHHAGMPVAGVIFDTLIAASLLVPEWQKKNLKALSDFYLHETMITFDDMVKELKIKNFAQVPLNLATHYAAADAHQTLQLYYLFDQNLRKQSLDTLFFTIEMPINDILVAMQLEGIVCDAPLLAKLDALVCTDLAKIEQEITAYTQAPINLNSPKQVGQLLFETLKLPIQKKSAKKTGSSTDAQVLATLAKIHPVPALLLKYRELFKLKSTYIESLPTFINPTTHKIHTSFNQALVATGRLSSSNPNLQNIPTGNLGYDIDIRSAFYAQPGQILLSADYSQIELRILAHVSQDQGLIEAFMHGDDVHMQTAMKIFNTPAEQISSAQRGVGKKINFSILYGLTSFGLSKDLEISYKDAEHYIATYLAQYPKVVAWMESVVQFTKEHGYTQTLFGRKRYLPGIYEKNRTLYDLAKRMAINTVAQGTAAEIMKLGMITCVKNLQQAGLQAKILLQIHDELILSVPQDQLETTKAIVQSSLESVVSWEFPLTVQIKTGHSWHDVTK